MECMPVLMHIMGSFHGTIHGSLNIIVLFADSFYGAATLQFL